MICDNIPGLVNKQRHLCQSYPDIMQAVGEGAKEWIRECQHQFRHHRWNCSTLDRDHTVFGRVMLRSKYPEQHPLPHFTELMGVLWENNLYFNLYINLYLLISPVFIDLYFLSAGFYLVQNCCNLFLKKIEENVRLISFTLVLGNETSHKGVTMQAARDCPLALLHLIQ